MAHGQSNNSLPQYYGQTLQDGTIMESPVMPNHPRASSDSRQELLRLPAQPHPAHLDFHMESEQNLPHQQQQGDPQVLRSMPSNLRRMGGQADPNDQWTPTRPRRPSQSGPYTPTAHRGPYVEEDYEDEEQDPRMYRRRSNRRTQGPPMAYRNYVEQNSRYGPIPRHSIDANMQPQYADTPGKPNYEMYYPEHTEGPRRRPPMPHQGSGQGPPEYPSAKAVMRLPWAVWMGSNAKNRKSSQQAITYVA
jgi:aquaporin related protein